MIKNVLLAADTPADTSWIIWVVLGVALLAMIVVPMFTRKKQANQVNTMLNAIKIGDKIKTIGGIIGVVIKIEQVSAVDREFVIESGDENKTQLRIDTQAVYQVMNRVDAPVIADAEVVPSDGAAAKEEAVSEPAIEAAEPIIEENQEQAAETEAKKPRKKKQSGDYVYEPKEVSAVKEEQEEPKEQE